MARKKHEPTQEEIDHELRAYIRRLERDLGETAFHWIWRNGKLQHPGILGLPGRWPATDDNDPDDAA